MHLPFPATQDVLLIGGGHAHALVLRMWGMNPLAGARLTVVNPGPIAPYTGMLPGAIAGHYAKRDLMIDLVRLARFAGARIILDRVVGLDPMTRLARLSSGRKLPYDVASIDIGIASDLPQIAGYAEHGVSAKPLGAYADRWEKFVATAKPHPRVTVIGGGVGGVELALASAHRLKAAGLDGKVTVLEKEPAPLPHHTVIVDRGPFSAEADEALMRDHKIDLVVSKNAGGTGSVSKLDAARKLGLPVLMIDRPSLPPRHEVHEIADVLTWLSA